MQQLNQLIFHLHSAFFPTQNAMLIIHVIRYTLTSYGSAISTEIAARNETVNDVIDKMTAPSLSMSHIMSSV